MLAMQIGLVVIIFVLFKADRDIFFSPLDQIHLLKLVYEMKNYLYSPIDPQLRIKCSVEVIYIISTSDVIPTKSFAHETFVCLCLSVGLSLSLSVSLSLSACLSICLSVCLCLSLSLCLCLCACLSACQSVSASLCLSVFVCVPVCLFVCLHHNQLLPSTLILFHIHSVNVLRVGVLICFFSFVFSGNPFWFICCVLWLCFSRIKHRV